ncbi:MAG: 16S rRNA (cytosine(967)-C(5))-methyltransferase RsmB [Neisseria sp.]|nr:16S rRNA (cytosine(967)-C(5))-methyltransferase RsmB [Neisseria sp.]
MSLRHVQLAAARCLSEVAAGRNLQQVLSAERALQNTWQPSERALFTDLAYGCQRFAGSLNFYVRALIDKPLSDKQCEAVLKVALYQLAYTRNAPHAVVHEAVAAVATLSKGKFKALVNAVLRRFLRERESLQAALTQDDTARDNFPAWWRQRLLNDYPHNAQHMMDYANTHPPLTLRVNRRHMNAQDYLALLQAASLEGVVLDEYALCVTTPVPVARLPRFQDGTVSVQDWGAQRAAALLDVHDGERVLDACAAPGGKTTHLLEWADCQLTALDVDPQRLQHVAENITRLGFQAALKAADAADTTSWFDGQLFDAILADVPCTASGVVRRNPDIKWLRRPNDAAKTAAQQVPLLDALWGCLKPGGRMLFATCSIFREENGAQTAAFLARHADAVCRLEEIVLPDEYRDGFYYALLDKT